MRNVVLILVAFGSCSTLLAAGKPKGYSATPPSRHCRECGRHHKHLAPAPPRGAVVDSVAIRRVERPRGAERDFDRMEELEREVELLRQQLEKATALLLQLGIQQSRELPREGGKPVPKSPRQLEPTDEDSGGY